MEPGEIKHIEATRTETKHAEAKHPNTGATRIEIKNVDVRGPKTNAMARTILTAAKDEVSDDDIMAALAVQQSHRAGSLAKLDLIAILIRLNPAKNNALISQYKVEDLIKQIRYELYVRPMK